MIIIFGIVIAFDYSKAEVDVLNNLKRRTK